jgi:hypothetical protein
VLRRGELLAAGQPTDVLRDQEVVRAARLVQPIVLETFGRLVDAGVLDGLGPPPRTAAELAELVAARLTQSQWACPACGSSAPRP